MCLYPKLIRNKKYIPNKKNNGIIPNITDERTRYVPVGCGKCVECIKMKVRNWKVRLNEELRHNNKALFVTLTFSEENLQRLAFELKNKNPVGIHENNIATLAVRRFLERTRKLTKKSIKHWLCTEKGHNGTERIHLHGILFTLLSAEDIKKLWSYGYVFVGQYVNEKTINYITKYVSKVDLIHKNYTPIILSSPGIGKNYINRVDSERNKYNSKKTNEYYYTRTGQKLPLPIYYRNKLYSDEERERLWLQKLNKNIRFVMGEKIDISTAAGIKNYSKLVEYYRKINLSLGYNKPENINDKEYFKKFDEIINLTKTNYEKG